MRLYETKYLIYELLLIYEIKRNIQIHLFMCYLVINASEGPLLNISVLILKQIIK